MIRDYGNRRGRPAATGGKPQPVGAVLAGMGVLPWLAVLAVVLVLWLAWAVRGGAVEMAAAQGRQEELRQQQQELQQRRDELLARQRIEPAAARLGLYPPQPEQVQNFGR